MLLGLLVGNLLREEVRTSSPQPYFEESLIRETKGFTADYFYKLINKKENLSLLAKKPKYVAMPEGQVAGVFVENNTEKPEKKQETTNENEKHEPNNELKTLTNQNINTNKKLTVIATAYCSGMPGTGCPVDEHGNSQCTGSYTDNITATGRQATAGTGTKADPHIIAVDPNVIPLNTLVYVKDSGYALAADTGGDIKGLRIDILKKTHEEALYFGRRSVEIQLKK